MVCWSAQALAQGELEAFSSGDFFRTSYWLVPSPPITLDDFTTDSSACNDVADSEPAPTLPLHEGGLWQSLWQSAREDWRQVRSDFCHFYLDVENLTCLALVLGGSAALANTHADQGIRDWYQDHVRHWSPYPSADETARILARAQRIQQTDGPEAANQAILAWRRERFRVPRVERWAEDADRLGKHWLVVPILVGSVAVGRIWEDYPLAENVGLWGERSIRALVVGSPAVGILQLSLGAGRPEEYASRWDFFDDRNGVSGHAFVGAIPFLTAASMVENRPLKATLFAASFATAWSRFHTNDHYLSQSILGWSIAFLAVRSVNQTERAERRWEITPIDLPQGPGVGVVVKW